MSDDHNKKRKTQLRCLNCFERFEPNASISNYQLQGDYLSFDVTGTDPYLTLKDELIIFPVDLLYPHHRLVPHVIYTYFHVAYFQGCGDILRFEFHGV